MADIIGRVKKSFDVVKDAFLLVSVALNVYLAFVNSRIQQRVAELELTSKKQQFDIQQQELKPQVVSRRIILPANTLKAFMDNPETLELPGSLRPAFVETALGKAIYGMVDASREEDLPNIEAEFLLFTNAGKVAADNLRLEGAPASTAVASLGALDPGTTKWFPLSLSVNGTVKDVEPTEYQRFHFSFVMLGNPLAEEGLIPAKAIRSRMHVRPLSGATTAATSGTQAQVVAKGRPASVKPTSTSLGMTQGRAGPPGAEELSKAEAAPERALRGAKAAKADSTDPHSVGYQFFQGSVPLDMRPTEPEPDLADGGCRCPGSGARAPATTEPEPNSADGGSP